MFERCLYFNANALVRRINRLWEQAFEQTGLSPAHAYLLRLVLEKDGLNQQQIADELQLEKSTVTRFVTVLEKKGYLLRTKSGREQIIQPSREAKKIRNRLNEIGDQLYSEMKHKIGDKEMQTLVAAFKQTANKL